MYVCIYLFIILYILKHFSAKRVKANVVRTRIFSFEEYIVVLHDLPKGLEDIIKKLAFCQLSLYLNFRTP